MTIVIRIIVMKIGYKNRNNASDSTCTMYAIQSQTTVTVTTANRFLII